MEWDGETSEPREFTRYAPRPGARYYRDEPMRGRNGSSLPHDRAPLGQQAGAETVSGSGGVQQMMESLHNVELQIDEADAHIKHEMRSLAGRRTPQAKHAPRRATVSGPDARGRKTVAGDDRQRRGASPRRPAAARPTPGSWPRRRVEFEPKVQTEPTSWDEESAAIGERLAAELVQRQEDLDPTITENIEYFGNKFTGPVGGARSCLLGRARTPAPRPRPLARLVRTRAHIRAHDTLCIMLGADIGANNNDHASTSQIARKDTSTRSQHQQGTWAHRKRASALASPQSPSPQPCPQVCAPNDPFDCTHSPVTFAADGRTTRCPLHGSPPPPSKGGSRGPGRGRAPTQHTILRLVRPDQLSERPLASLPTAMIADLEKNTEVVRLGVLFQVACRAIRLPGSSMFHKSEKWASRALPPFVASP